MRWEMAGLVVWFASLPLAWECIYFAQLRRANMRLQRLKINVLAQRTERVVQYKVQNPNPALSVLLYTINNGEYLL
jgi:hypothetical protein